MPSSKAQLPWFLVSKLNCLIRDKLIAFINTQEVKASCLVQIPSAEDSSETWDHVLELLPASLQQVLSLVLFKGMYCSLDT